MELMKGHDIDWPEEDFKAESDDIIIVLDHLNLCRIERNKDLPGLQSSKTKELNLKLRPTRDCSIKIEPQQPNQKRGAWLEKQLRDLINDDTSNHESGNILILFQKLHQQENLEFKRRLTAYQSLNKSTSTEILNRLEQTSPSADQHWSDQTLSTKDPFLACISILSRGELKPIPDANTRKDGRLYLEKLLQLNHLIGRNVVLDKSDLKRDCGDLIAFREGNASSPILLQMSKKGYRVWDPQTMKKPRLIQHSHDIVSILSPRMVSISPAFAAQDLTTIGLLRFAYGNATKTTAFILSGLLVGIIAGFLLSVSNEVGGLRWIFGLGITGTLIGTALGVLSGGLRLGVAVMFLATALSLLTPSFNTIITNQALPDQDFNLLLQISALLIIAGLTRVSLNWIQSRAILLTQQKGAAKAQLASMQHLLSLPIEFFRNRNVGELQLRFGALDELRNEIQQLLEGGIIQVVMTSIYILFMLNISTQLTILAVIISLLILLPTVILSIQARPLQRRQEEAEAQAQSRNLELISSVTKLRIAGAETAAAKWWADQYRIIVNQEYLIDAKEATSNLLQTIIPNLGTLLIYIMVTKIISESTQNPQINAPNIGELLGFFTAFGTFIGAVASFAGLLIGAFDMPIIYERARPILNATPEKKDNQAEAGVLLGEIVIDRVSYRYEPGLPLVLDGISFAAKAEEYVAIVGPSGSGKSTLVRLLLGFAFPENGNILMDGQPLQGLNIESVRRQIGTVMQTNSLFSGTLIEAIAGGAIINEQEAWHAAEMAGLAEDIHNMPMGLQTMLSDGGLTLSGGQRQRVAIARALVRKPKILIFDEATSALDNRTQAIVSQSLDELKVTRLVIAHRLSTIRQANRIVVLEQGQVKEQGTYEELMRNKQFFSELVRRQT